MLSYDVDLIIETLVKDKREEEGKVVYPALRALFNAIKNINHVVSVGVEEKKLHVSVTDLKDENCKKISPRREQNYSIFYMIKKIDRKTACTKKSRRKFPPALKLLLVRKYTF